MTLLCENRFGSARRRWEALKTSRPLKSIHPNYVTHMYTTLTPHCGSIIYHVILLLEEDVLLMLPGDVADPVPNWSDVTTESYVCAAVVAWAWEAMATETPEVEDEVEALEASVLCS